MTTPLVHMSGICKRFPGVAALSDVDFTLMPGEVHTLLGENGAGKSTLMKVLGGIYMKDAGSIRIGGAELEMRSPRQALEQGIAFVHQELMLCNNVTVAENLFLPENARRMPVGRFGWKGLFTRARQLLDNLGLHIDPRAMVGELPIAQQQMVEIARAVTRQVRILILDEPTSSLSEEDTAFLFRIVRTLRGQGVGIIFISHRLKEVLEITDRISVLRDGRNVATVPKAEATLERLVTMMVGRDVRIQRRAAHTPGSLLLEVKGLTRRGAFSDVSFVVRAGEVVGLAGLVGAGRTEVARAIVGADPLDAGELQINGKPGTPRSPQEAVQKGVALVPEDRKKDGLVLEQTVAVNMGLVVMHSLQRGGFLQKQSLRAMATQLVGHLHVRTPGIDQEVQYLSGGNQQKVVIGKWLAASPRVLILDEPTRGIDVGAKAEIYGLIGNLAADGHAVLVISSELPEILALSDRILVMAEGRLTGELHGDEATEEKIMALCHLPHLEQAPDGAA